MIACAVDVAISKPMDPSNEYVYYQSVVLVCNDNRRVTTE